MELLQLQCFISVVRHLSFTKAAEDCHVVQATISRQISALEKELGCKLFERDSHGVRTTPAGDMLAHYAPVFLEYQKAILDHVRNATASSRQTLRFGVGPYEHILIRNALTHINIEKPEIAVDLNAYTYYVLLTRYRNKVLDIAFCNELCATQMPEYTRYKLASYPWYVAAAQDHPIWTLPYDEQQSLFGQTLITLVNDSYDGIRKYCYDHFISTQMVETNFLTTLIELVQSGMGIAILPSFVKPVLPSNIYFRNVLNVPFYQSFYAMVSPSLDSKLAESIINILRSTL